MEQSTGKPCKRAFFGRRKGKKLRPRQMALLRTTLPKLALDLARPPPARLQDLFADARDVRLEIGFGGGEHLAAEAERNGQGVGAD
jgi:tRNA (guanine-N7-)-methyltransferase